MNDDYRPWRDDEVPEREMIILKGNANDETGMIQHGFIWGVRTRDHAILIIWSSGGPSAVNAQWLFDNALVRDSDTGTNTPCGVRLHHPTLHAPCNPPEP